jgi:hypothetical protein
VSSHLIGQIALNELVLTRDKPIWISTGPFSMNSATAKKAIAEKASLPTSGKLRRLAVAVTTACVLATSTSAWAKSAC